MSKLVSEFSVRSDQLQKLNGIVLQEDFQKRLNEVRNINVTLTQKPTQGEIEIAEISSNPNSVIDFVESIGHFDLDPQKGNELSKVIGFAGYDESKYKFLTLEGIAHITSHALAIYVQNDIFPITTLTFYFYTKSKKILNSSEYIKFSEDIESDSNRDYALDRSQFISKYAINNSLIFIDGPIIGGNMTSYTLKLVEYLHSLNIVPIFIVKNSSSNLVVDNIPSIKNDFNSDLHWSYEYLKQGQRSNLFRYIDRYNAENSKIFCYIKPFNSVTTQRIEFHPNTYKLYNDVLGEIFDLVYYLMIVHGDKSNPQIRPIAVAEKYARETIRLINSDTLLRNSSLIQTLDQTRFGG